MKPSGLNLALVSIMLGGPAAAMTLASADIAPNAQIGAAHIYPSCGGQNIAPALTWTGTPRAAKSLVLTMIDLDAKPAMWSHWIVVDLPSSTKDLARGGKSLPGSAHVVANNFGEAAYGGPCPPRGSGVHRYQFTLWAMPAATTAVPGDGKADEIAPRLARTALAHASFIGWVKR